MISVLRDDDVGEQAFARQPSLDACGGAGAAVTPSWQLRDKHIGQGRLHYGEEAGSYSSFSDTDSPMRVLPWPQGTDLSASGISISIRRRGRGRQRAPACSARRPACCRPGGSPGVHLGRLSGGVRVPRRAGRTRAAAARRLTRFRFPSKQFVAEDVELMAERRVFRWSSRASWSSAMTAARRRESSLVSGAMPHIPTEDGG